MPNPVLRVPGVYVQEQRPRNAQALPTGVPVFIGFIKDDAPVPANVIANAAVTGPCRCCRNRSSPAARARISGMR